MKGVGVVGVEGGGVGGEGGESGVGEAKEEDTVSSERKLCAFGGFLSVPIPWKGLGLGILQGVTG